MIYVFLVSVFCIKFLGWDFLLLVFYLWKFYILIYIIVFRVGWEFDWNILFYELDFNIFYLLLRRIISDEDCDGWFFFGDGGFMVCSEIYNENNFKVWNILYFFYIKFFS